MGLVVKGTFRSWNQHGLCRAYCVGFPIVFGLGSVFKFDQLRSQPPTCSVPLASLLLGHGSKSQGDPNQHKRQWTVCHNGGGKAQNVRSVFCFFNVPLKQSAPGRESQRRPHHTSHVSSTGADNPLAQAKEAKAKAKLQREAAGPFRARFLSASLVRVTRSAV